MENRLKRIIVGISLLFLLNCISAENNNFSVKFNPEFGVLMGTVNEYVFDDHCKNTDNMLSRLDWDLRCTPYFSGNLYFTIAKLIYIGVNGKIAIHGKSGYMQDYDWQNSTTAAWINDNPYELTNYSKSTNHLDNYYNLCFTAGGKIPISEKIYITPLLSYEYFYIKFRATDGYYSYKTDNFEVHNLTGDCITYEQEAKILKTGVKLDFNPFTKMSISTDFFISPGTANITALDCHIDTHTAFLDEIKNGYLLQSSNSVFYLIDSHNKIGFTLNFEYLPVTKGQTSSKPLDSNNKPNTYISWNKATNNIKGGTSHFIFNCGIIYSLYY